MQAFVYLGLFGAVFFAMVSVTVGAMYSTVQQQQAHVQKVKKMYTDIAHAINDVVLQTNGILTLSLPDNPPGNDNPNSLAFLAPYVGFTIDDMTTDPWGMPFKITRIDNTETLGAYGPACTAGNELTENCGGAKVQVSYYAVISAGPDRKFDTTLPTDITSWKNLNSAGAPAGSDDMVLTFSDQDALQKLWNHSVDIDQQVMRTVEKIYQGRVQAFVNRDDANNPVVQFYQCVNNPDQTFCNQFTPSVLAACEALSKSQDEQDQLASVNCWKTDPKMHGMSGYPSMAGVSSGGTYTCMGKTDGCNVPLDAFGLTKIASSQASGGQDIMGGVTLLYDDTDPSKIRVTRSTNMADTGWNINTSMLVDGDANP